MPKELHTDDKGNIIVRPLVGYSTHHIAGIVVLLTVEYVETEEGLNTGYSQSVQLGLTPQQCIELADSLKNAANGILQKASPDTPIH